MAEIPMLGEHDAPKADSVNPGAYSPTDEERKTIRMVNKLFEKAKKHRQKYDHKWTDYYRMFRGKQWKEERPSYRHSAVFNLVFRVIQSQAPIQTDTQPRIQFLPTEPSDLPLSEILNEVVESDWERNGWLLPLAEVVYDANIYSTGFGKPGFDEKAEDGLGQISFESGDPFYCFPDPEARDVNCNRRKFFIYAEPVDVDRLKKEYPDKAAFLKGDLIDFLDNERENLQTFRYRSPTDNKTILESDGKSDGSEKNRALKITCWLFADEMVEDEKSEVNPQTGEQVISTVQRLKYPKGRKICISNNVLLDDDENDEPSGKVPLVRLVNYMLPREFWGISEIEQIEGPQITYNKIFSFALDVLTLMGNPIWIVDNDSGVDTDNLFNRPGLVVEKNKGSEVRREEGVQLQPYVLNMLEKIGAVIDDIAGNNDVSRGIKPEGVTAAKAIQELQDTAQTRLRQKSRFLDVFLQQFGQLYLAQVFDKYTAPRIFRLTNDENVPKYFKFHVETDEAGDRYARVRQMMPQEDGSAVFADEQKFKIQGNFDVKVGTGSSLPFAKAERESTAYNLFDRQIIDAEEVLKVIDWPNREAVLQRMQQQAQMAAEAQAQQQMQKAAGQG